MNISNEKNCILFLTSYPPVECGIATYSQDLLHEFRKILPQGLDLKICAIENSDYNAEYPEEVCRVFDSRSLDNYIDLAKWLNNDRSISAVFIEHEFGLFGGKNCEYPVYFIKSLNKPVYITMHTVLPNPDAHMEILVEEMCKYSSGITVMTKNAAHILSSVYNVEKGKIHVIPHGTHRVDHIDKNLSKKKYGLDNRLVLSTFGLLSRNKSIETVLDALIPVVRKHPHIIYLVLGKTHPGVIRYEGETYRKELMKKLKENMLTDNVRFINKYLSLEELLEFLMATDIYLFTSKDRYQAVSGTLSYAMGTGLPVFSTPIPQAKETLGNAGLFYDFENPGQLSDLLLYVIKNPDVIEVMKNSSYRRADLHTWNKIAGLHLSMILKTLGKRKGSFKGEKIFT